MTVWPYTTSTSSTSPYVYKVYSQSGDLIYTSYKNQMEFIKKVSPIHKELENLQDQIFTRGKIEGGEQVEEDEQLEYEPEAIPENLQYFDPKYLDI